MKFLNFILALAALAGLVCGGFVSDLTHDPVLAAVAAVACALLIMHTLALLVIKVTHR